MGPPFYSDIYAQLGFDPLDEFMSKGSMMDHGQPRRLGATTWMLVAILHHLKQGKQHVYILADNFQMVDGIIQRLKSLILMSKDMNIRWESTHQRELRCRNSVYVRWGSRDVDVRGAAQHAYKFFDDLEWHQRAVRRLKGPFAMMREVRLVNGRYLAYAEDDEFLFETYRDVAEEMGRKNPIKFVGWDG